MDPPSLNQGKEPFFVAVIASKAQQSACYSEQWLKQFTVNSFQWLKQFTMNN
jgi:hypothetical protein|tara:strand:- start:239 stop:394 length:156 start_codon:yes stop_codon:yes gene_type:complete